MRLSFISKKKRVGASLFFSGLLIIGFFIVAVPSVNWRAQVLGLKLRGQLPELNWAELFRILQPGSPYYVKKMEATRNPYRSIQNPLTSKDDIKRGEGLFRSQCAGCHGLQGVGGSGPRLARSAFEHGSSDWAIFQSISEGIPGTAMEGRDLPEVAIWQIVAYVRALAVNSSSVDPPANVVSTLGSTPPPSVGYERLLQAESEPGNWLTYSGTYTSQRYSRLAQINRENASEMTLKWVFQMPSNEKIVETTPLVVGGMMYLTEPPNNVWAIETGTGQPLWSYKRKLPDKMPLCCGRVNRGVAVLGNKIYLATLDAHLVALDARTGQLLWDVEVVDYHLGYSMTSAPLAIRDKVIVGVAGGEYGVRGFLDAYDARTGERVWRFYTVPGPDEPGHETWSGDSWKTGGAPTWLTGSFDPELNLIYWGVGNPAPIFQGDGRQGDNLYSNCVIALDADTGHLKWYFQFTPHDEHDWDAIQIPVLVDVDFRGRPRKLMLWANRNAFYYVLDRVTGAFLTAREFSKQTWADRIDDKGRPVVRPNTAPSRQGTLVYPGSVGATNWWSPSFSPSTGLLYVPVLQRAEIFFKGAADFKIGEITEREVGYYEGSAAQPVAHEPYWKAILALVAQTGERKWEYRIPIQPLYSRTGGTLCTVGDLVFGGDNGLFFALDARTGKEVWRASLGGEVIAAPITYLCGDQQQVSIAAGRALFTFGLTTSR